MSKNVENVATVNAEVAEAVETTETTEAAPKKRRGRVAKPAMTLTDAFRMFDSGELNAFSAEYGKGKMKAIIVNLNGAPSALAPADAGSGFMIQDYDKCRNSLTIIDSAYPVSVKAI